MLGLVGTGTFGTHGGFLQSPGPIQDALFRWPLREGHLLPIGQYPTRTPVLSPVLNFKNQVCGSLLVQKGQRSAHSQCWPTPSPMRLSGAGVLPPQDDYKIHQKLLKRVALNLGLQLEVLKESSHSLVVVLAMVSSSKVALPLRPGLYCRQLLMGDTQVT